MNISVSQKYYAVAIVIILGVTTAYRLGFLNPLENGLRATIDQFLAKSRTISFSIGSEYAFFKNREEFFDATRSCFERVQNLSVDEARLHELETENALLKDQLAYKQTQTSSLRLAQIITADSSHIEKIVTINQGNAEGISVGMPAIAGKGILIGKVIRTNEHSSHIRLVNDSLSRVEATTLNHDQTIGVVEGGFGISLQMKFVPRSEVIRVNQQVITSGREPGIPRGLLLGTVTTVENEAYQGFQRVTLSPNIDLSKLSFVSIILTPSTE